MSAPGRYTFSDAIRYEMPSAQEFHNGAVFRTSEGGHPFTSPRGFTVTIEMPGNCGFYRAEVWIDGVVQYGFESRLKDSVISQVRCAVKELNRGHFQLHGRVAQDSRP
jgi:hypothetical protein